MDRCAIFVILENIATIRRITRNVLGVVGPARWQEEEIKYVMFVILWSKRQKISGAKLAVLAVRNLELNIGAWITDLIAKRVAAKEYLLKLV